MRRSTMALLAALPAFGHTSLFTAEGVAYTRSDYGNITVSYNSDFRAGALNTNGRAMITAGSNPLGALQASLNSWSGIAGSRIRFGGLASTPFANDTKDLQNVMMLRDSPEIRSLVGDSAAVTVIMALPTTGEITDADILFSPSLADQGLPFSTSGGIGTLDLQAIATHELGHLLGAGHSHLLAATQFPTGGSAVRRTLSSDEVAFARSAAPVPGVESQYGIIRGVVSTTTGQPARGIAVTATDPANGITLGALTDTTGAYSMPSVPAGSYILFAEPLDGPALPSHFQIQALDAELNVEAAFFDGKRPIAVAGGTTGTANFTLARRVGSVHVNLIAQGQAGGSGDISSTAVPEAAGGSSLDLLIGGPGVDGLAGFQVELIGAGATIRPGSVRADPRLVFADGTRIVRFTVDLPDALQRSMVSVIVQRGAGMSTVAGGLVVTPTIGPTLGLTPNSVVNAATATTGPLAPNSWVSIFARNLARSFVLGDESLPFQIDGTAVAVVDSQGVARPARLQFVSPEQINFLMPANVASGTARIMVTSLLAQGSTDIQVAYIGPGIFAANSNGRGPAAATYVRVLPGGAQQSGLTFGTDKTPRENVPLDLAAPVYLTFYGTGIRARATPVTATVGGVDVPVLAAVA